MNFPQAQLLWEQLPTRSTGENC